MAESEIPSHPPWDEDDSSSPSKTPPSTTPPSHPRFPTPQTLRSWLPLYMKKPDATLSHLSRILSTPTGTDSLLSITQYSTLATSTALTALSLRRLHTHILRLLSSAANALPANTTILIPPTAIEPPFLLRLSQSLKALSDLISDFRTFTRLWALLSIYKRARHLSTPSHSDRVLARIAWSQVLVNALYQVLESGAYLASKGVLGWDKKKQARAWVWSSRFWAAHVALEFTRLGYLWTERRKMRAEGKETVEGKVEDEKLWRRDLVSNLAYAPLTVHWSLEEGLLGDFWIGVLGTVAGAAGFAELWKETA